MMQPTAAGRAARHLAISSVLGVLLAACGDSTEPPPPVATVELSPTSDTVRVGETAQLSVTLKDASGNILNERIVAWTSGSPTIASISQSGLVTGLSDGTAIITATSENATGSASVRVLNPCSTALAPSIGVGQTVNGSLTSTDCRLDDDTYADGYGITVTSATNVQIDMTASFDTYLFLLELLPNGDLVEHAFNDDVDPDDPDDPNDSFDTNSRITFTLQPNLQYFILANSFDPNVFGAYQLKVAAVAFVAGKSVAGKPGKAPISSLIKAIKPAK